MKFVLLVEGPTERALAAFLKRWLDAHLDPKVGVQTSKPGGGCCRLVEDMPKKASMFLAGPRAKELIGVIGLLDLHGLAHPSHMQSSSERLDWWTSKIEGSVDHPRFRVFFAVHDVEAWLLSQPGIFPQRIQEALADKTKDPERVNADEPPARLLQRVYRRVTNREYKKVTHGTELFGKLDPSIAYSKCPQLKKMLDHMREEALHAGCKEL